MPRGMIGEVEESGTGALRRVVGAAGMSTWVVSLLRDREAVMAASRALESSEWFKQFLAVDDQHVRAQR